MRASVRDAEMKGSAGAALACLAVAQIDPLGFARGDDLQRAAMAFANPLYATLADVHQPLLRSSRSTFSSYRFKPENSRSVHSVDGFRERNRSWTAPAACSEPNAATTRSGSSRK